MAVISDTSSLNPPFSKGEVVHSCPGLGDGLHGLGKQLG